MECEGGFACAGVGGEEGEASAGEVVVPEPGEGLRGDLGEGECGHERAPFVWYMFGIMRGGGAGGKGKMRGWGGESRGLFVY